MQLATSCTMFVVQVAALAEKNTHMSMERKHLIRLAENRLHLTLEEIPFFPSTWLFFETFMQDLMLTVRDPATSGLSLARKFRHQGELFVGGFAAHGFIFYTVSVLLI